ncbi:MAG: hypothetical protein HY855_01415 [Burkholderiales bacterium]|nr:hypothetical protein [Burkholderiales bacterium]
MPHKPPALPAAPDDADAGAGGRIAEALLDVVGRIPRTQQQRQDDPATAARDIANKAAARAALAAGSLALPPGPLGWLTMLPELLTVWKVQSQMVADIAAVFGRSAGLGREQMLYCLFRHAASQAVRDLVVRAGERWLVRKASTGLLKSIARRIGTRWAERTVGRGFTRWMPVIGAVGVGAYAYYDTVQVAITAIELFEREVATDEPDAEDPTEGRSTPRR